ncbi:hypothetical protein HVA01_25310 [Halovibrio variabilis]|uniref:GmrSD restriction endonucleases N-terminal domain-containing protein n=1 Tax=Halovibrio variabilis TaxID=31910 RepID=A0A511UQL9_9GAMM|nr:DUF262 domain-containing protein [Halovibrio variabilis]GEN28885.1 hypothetical protein HVA01_25310 [Halovibrio variabilis]
MADLVDVVTKKRNTLKTDRLDMSFGELMNIFEDGDLFITPEYQRVFRWSDFQKTRFIESVLLGIPIPPIFVAEDDDGRWEVVDGLQRISTIFAFFGLLESMPEKNNSTLTQGEIVKELEGVTIDSMPIKLKTTIKRSVCRVEIVKWDSKEDIRYELFNRLNTGSSPLSDQEIRNCIFRAYDVDLNKILKEIAQLPEFESLISPSDTKKEQMFLEELSLRYFAFKYLTKEFKTTVPQFLTEFMQSVSKGEILFDLEEEKESFVELIKILNNKYGKGVFRPKGNFALHIFDSISYALPKVMDDFSGNQDHIFSLIDKLQSDQEYNDIGTSTFSNMRIRNRMNRALEIFSGS